MTPRELMLEYERLDAEETRLRLILNEARRARNAIASQRTKAYKAWKAAEEALKPDRDTSRESTEG